MYTDDWTPHYNDGQNDEGRNRERRPYNLNRSGYGNQSNYRNYGRQEGRYNRNPGNYERSYISRYDRSGRTYDNQSGYGDNNMKRRRLRVGETVPVRSYDNRNHIPREQQDSCTHAQHLSFRNSKSGIGDLVKRVNLNNTKYMKYREENFNPEELIRLNRYLANTGVCSRREADEYIKSGAVKVNGEQVTEMGRKVCRADKVTFFGETVTLEHKIYLLLNKPRNCITATGDPDERLTVMDLVKTACQERIFPVGRLDRNTTGVLLLTNDGDLAAKLTHPKYLKKKIYHVWLNKEVSVVDMQHLADGIELEDGEIHADAISYVNDDIKDQVGIEIHSGRNRVVRRMFESLGYEVVKLDRVYFAGLTKKNVKKGHWRFLNEKEVSMLRMGAFE